MTDDCLQWQHEIVFLRFDQHSIPVHLVTITVDDFADVCQPEHHRREVAARRCRVVQSQMSAQMDQLCFRTQHAYRQAFGVDPSCCVPEPGQVDVMLVVGGIEQVPMDVDCGVWRRNLRHPGLVLEGIRKARPGFPGDSPIAQLLNLVHTCPGFFWGDQQVDILHGAEGQIPVHVDGQGHALEDYHVHARQLAEDFGKLPGVDPILNRSVEVALAPKSNEVGVDLQALGGFEKEGFAASPLTVGKFQRSIIDYWMWAGFFLPSSC